MKKKKLIVIIAAGLLIAIGGYVIWDNFIKEPKLAKVTVSGPGNIGIQ